MTELQQDVSLSEAKERMRKMRDNYRLFSSYDRWFNLPGIKGVI